MRTHDAVVNSSTPTGLLRKRAVLARVPFSGTTLWRLTRAGDFPKPVQLSKGTVAWREADVDRWIAERAPRSPEAA